MGIYRHTSVYSIQGRYGRTLEPHIPLDVTGRVLDAGCAYGISTIELLELHPRANVVGMDIFEANIFRALERKNRLDESARRRLEFIVGDFENLDPTKTGTFAQIVAANNVLNAAGRWTEHDLHTVMSSLYNSLKPAGHLVLSEGRSVIVLRKDEDNGCFAMEKEVSDACSESYGWLMRPACEPAFFSPFYEPEHRPVVSLHKTVAEKVGYR